MAAAEGEKAAEEGQMGMKAADEEKGAVAVEKGEMGVKVADEEKGATAVEKEEKDSAAADEEEGEKSEEKGKKRETAAAEKGLAADWGLVWKWKGVTAADGEGPKPRREPRRWRSKRRELGAVVAGKGEDTAAATKGAGEKNTAAATEGAGEKNTAAATEGPGEKTVFFFSAVAPAAGKMITLVSSEGHKFRVSEAAARLSAVLGDMIDNGCVGGNIPISNADDRALATVIKYCNKHAASGPDSNNSAAEEGGSCSSASTAASEKELDEWDRKLVDDLTMDALYDLIGAANFLNIKGLLEASCQKVADMIKNKTPAQVRTIFSIANDFTAEEEEEIRKESPWAFEDKEA